MSVKQGLKEGVEEDGVLYPFSIGVLLLLVRFVQILGVETDDSDGKDELEQAKRRIKDKEDEASASLTIFESHLERLVRFVSLAWRRIAWLVLVLCTLIEDRETQQSSVLCLRVSQETQAEDGISENKRNK